MFGPHSTPCPNCGLYEVRKVRRIARPGEAPFRCAACQAGFELKLTLRCLWCIPYIVVALGAFYFVNMWLLSTLEPSALRSGLVGGAAGLASSIPMSALARGFAYRPWHPRT